MRGNPLHAGSLAQEYRKAALFPKLMEGLSGRSGPRFGASFRNSFLQKLNAVEVFPTG